MSAARDYQRSAVYRAETMFRAMTDRQGPVDIAGTCVTIPPMARFGDIAGAQRHVDRVLTHPGVLAEFGDRGPVTVRIRRGDTAAHYEFGKAVIAVPDTSGWLKETTLTHELAHHFSPADRHGAAFTETHLRLLELTVGPEAAFVLGILYRESGVDIG